MIVGIGIDIVPVGRIVSLWHRHSTRMCETIFTPAELAACGIRTDSSGHPAQSELTLPQAMFLAERFAGKEATIKAVGLSYSASFEFSEIDISGSGALDVRLTGALKDIAAAQRIDRLTGSCTLSKNFTIACIIGESSHA